ncbi:MAG: DcaP family trimeric outer membrane transporter [Caldimonas sp.]
MNKKHKLTRLALCLSAAISMMISLPAAAQQQPDVQAQIRALQKQLQDLQAQVNNAQASADTIEKTGGAVNKDHPGFWRLPGTDTWMGIGGHVKADFIYDSKESVGPQTDFSAIPMNGAPGTDRKNTFSGTNAKQTEIDIETHTPTDYGDLASRVETDFYLSTQGNPNISNSYALRLRNAYFSLGPLLAGQWWTAFQDQAAGPNLLDFNGPAGQVFVRQPQIRYTHVVPGEGTAQNQYIFSVENSSPDYFSPGGLYNGNVNNVNQDGQTADPAGCTLGRVTPCSNGPSQLSKYPDFVTRWENDGDYGHVSLQAMARDISVDTGVIGVPAGQVVKTSKWGYGLGVSGQFNMNTVVPRLGGDNILWSFQGGPGIGRYLQDLLFNGAILNDTTHNLDVVTSLGGFVAYEHFWSDRWESNVSFGWEESKLKDIDQLIADGVQLTSRSISGHVNLIVHPYPNVTLGAEAIVGRRYVKGFIPVGQEAHGDLTRYQVTAAYQF